MAGLNGAPVRGLVLVAVTVAALSGCGGDSAGSDSAVGEVTGEGPATPRPSTAGVAPAVIAIENFKFTPTPLQVMVGQKVTVTNTDSVAHTATASDASFDTKDLVQGQSYTFTADKAGTVDYLCDIHQYMTGRIVVSLPAPPVRG